MEIITAILYYFRQIGKMLGENASMVGGNLDPFYGIAPLYLAKNYKDKKKMLRLIVIIAPIFIFAGIQLIFLDNVNILRMLVNTSKIAVCIMCLLYVKENYSKFNIKKIAKIVSIFYAISIPLAYIFSNNTTIWRLNDIHNKYSLRRLNLFYIEPSELGFHIAIILIILVGYLLATKERKEQGSLLVLIIANVVVLYMARPLGAMVICMGSIGLMLLIDLIYNPTKIKFKIYAALAGLGVILAIYMMINKTPIYMRIIETLNGTDASNSYRIGVCVDVLKQSFIDFKGIGCGFGNLNTSEFISQYSDLGLVVVVTNSFMYFIIEAGVFGILTLIIGIGLLVKISIKSKSVIKWGLLIFLLMYQIFAGHFTSAVYWILYGLILSDYDEYIN